MGMYAITFMAVLLMAIAIYEILNLVYGYN